MSNQNRKPLFANVLNLPWSVSKADESVIVDVNGDIVATIGLNLFPELAADEEACTERAKALVNSMNVSAPAKVLRDLRVGDVLGSNGNKDIRDQRLVSVGPDVFGEMVIHSEVVDTGEKATQSIGWTQMFLESGMIVVR